MVDSIGLAALDYSTDSKITELLQQNNAKSTKMKPLDDVKN